MKLSSHQPWSRPPAGHAAILGGILHGEQVGMNADLAGQKARSTGRR